MWRKTAKMWVVLFLVGLVGVVSSFDAMGQTEADYTHGVTYLSASQARIWFAPNGFSSAWVDVHYTVNNGVQQNVRMTYNSSTGRHEHTVNGLQNGDVINYWFTYEKNGPAYNTPTYTYTHSGSTSSGNLALNRPAFSSSNENSTLTPDKAVDGNTGTRWSSAFSDPQWIYVDLGATYNINRVVLRWETAYGRAYQIQVSNNASTWTTIYSTSNGDGGVDDLSVSGTGRYVRMYGTARGTPWGYSLWEFEVYGSPASPPTPTPTPQQQPYGGTPWAIPGTIQAENYDTGGEGVAYHDTTAGNSGGAYRSDSVDIESTSDAGGGYNVGWIDAGEWLEYTVNVASSGTYYVEARVASLSAGGTLHVEFDGVNKTGPMSFGATGGWQNWITVTSGTFSLSAGQHVMRVVMDSSLFNVNWIAVRSASAPTPTPTPTGRTLVWSDEFNGPNIDLSNWNFETGCTGWGNAEWENYTNGDNSFITYDPQAGSNVLVIEARETTGGQCGYTSSRMTTQGKREFTYGRIEARIKLPQTQGIWPAFWMLGNDIGSVGWPNCGEIDIMEHVGFEPTLTHGAIHGPGYFGATPFTGTFNLGEVVDANYHVYAIEWDPNTIRWYVDNNNFYTVTRSQVEQYGPWVFDHPFFIILNVAVGGTWPGYPDSTSVFPQRMYVDYVRVYQ